MVCINPAQVRSCLLASRCPYRSGMIPLSWLSRNRINCTICFFRCSSTSGPLFLKLCDIRLLYYIHLSLSDNGHSAWKEINLKNQVSSPSPHFCARCCRLTLPCSSINILCSFSKSAAITWNRYLQLSQVLCSRSLSVPSSSSLHHASCSCPVNIAFLVFGESSIYSSMRTAQIVTILLMLILEGLQFQRIVQ